MLQNLDIPVGLAFHRQPRTAMERRPYRVLQLAPLNRINRWNE